MGVYTKIERWGRNNPVLETIAISKEDGIEIKVPIEVFIKEVCKRIGYGAITAYSASSLENKLKESIASVVKDIKEETRTVADLIH